MTVTQLARPPVQPTHRQIQAAFYVARMLKADGSTLADLARSYRILPTGALHDHESLSSGERLLVDVELLTETGARVVPTAQLLALRRLPLESFVETLLFFVLTEQRELWLDQLAITEEVPWELVPADVAAALASTFEHPEQREAFVLAAARKVDRQALEAFGAEGEESVLEACRKHLTGLPHLIDEIAHVSLVDDTLGYDIASPDRAGHRHRIEVKATSALPGWAEFFLSRNEASVGKHDPQWSLVVTRREVDADKGALVMRVVGWLRFADLEDLLPKDPSIAPDDSARSTWASCRVTLPDDRLRPALPLDWQT
jgi:Domain of unknown function (DUF3883)